jgi:hypothetical protein
MAAEMPADPDLERRTLRRSHRRRGLNASLAGAVAVAVVAVGFAGLRFVATDRPTVPVTHETSSPTPAPASLPAAVADTRDSIVSSVATGDIDGLRDLLDPTYFGYNGGEGADPITEWRRDPSALEPIPQILEMPFHATPEIEAPDGFIGRFYQWPYLMRPGSLDEVSEQERADLHALGFDDRDIEAMRGFGSYTGPRLVIREDGVWTGYFTGGD